MDPLTIPQLDLADVILRPLHPRDGADLFEAYSDQEAMKFRRNPPLSSIADANTMIEDAPRCAPEGKSLASWRIQI